MANMVDWGMVDGIYGQFVWSTYGQMQHSQTEWTELDAASGNRFVTMMEYQVTDCRVHMVEHG